MEYYGEDKSLTKEVRELGYECEYDSGFYWVKLPGCWQRLAAGELWEFVSNSKELEVN